jgi:hypothetical protein
VTNKATNPESMPEYKGGPLDADRGPGLGCFWIQAVALVIAMILAPLSAVLNPPRLRSGSSSLW